MPRHLATLARASGRGRRAADQVHWLQTRGIQVREVSGQEVDAKIFPALIHIHLKPGDSFFMNLSRLTSIYFHLLNLNSALLRKKPSCVSLSILHLYSTRLPMPNGCPTIQLHSDTVYLEIVSDPTGERA